MVTLEEAIHLALSNAVETDTETVPFTEALQRILAEDVISDIDIPPFNKSAMDGYALRKEDVNQSLRVIEVVQAGNMPSRNLLPGECVKIMTGARIPDNANYVAKIEDTEIDEQGNIRIKKTENKSNIRLKAEDVKKDEKILSKGTLLRPQEIATLATVGKTMISVYKKPSLCIASTGNELVEPEQKPTDYQIRNSNAYQLVSQCMSMGIHPYYYGIIEDEINSTQYHLNQMLHQHNIIILTGGVSMGDFDFIPETIKQLGYDIVFQTINVQPGKPTMMARKGNKYIFGLPGNPVSSFMQFELIVKPFLYKMMGHQYVPAECKAPLAQEYYRKKAERTSIVPVKIENNTVIPVEYHGSAHLFALNDATGFIIIPEKITEIPANTYVTVRFI